MSELTIWVEAKLCYGVYSDIVTIQDAVWCQLNLSESDIIVITLGPARTGTGSRARQMVHRGVRLGPDHLYFASSGAQPGSSGRCGEPSRDQEHRPWCPRCHQPRLGLECDSVSVCLCSPRPLTNSFTLHLICCQASLSQLNSPDIISN